LIISTLAMWAIGFVAIVIVALIGVIWVMLLGKIKDNEDDIKILKAEMKGDMKKIDQTCNDIFREIKCIKDGLSADRVHVAETCVTKTECIRQHTVNK